MKKKFGIEPKTFTFPMLHNYWFEKYSIDASYSTIETDENNLNNIINRIRS